MKFMCVIHLTTEYKCLRVIGREGSNDGCFNSPDDLDFDDTGNVYVVDQENHRIQVLTPEGEHLRNIGGSGELSRPISIAIQRDLLYITDNGNRRIAVYSTAGDFVTTFGEGSLMHPECIAIDDNGYIFVTDGRFRLFRF